MTCAANSLLLVTNLSHEDRAEDLFLADILSKQWNVSVTSPSLAVQILAAGNVTRCVIRNAWPSREFKSDFRMLEALAQNRRVEFYNPLGRSRGPIEDKGYLADLYRHGLPVIPTYLDIADLAAAGHTGTILCKPIDGCSSAGIVEAMSTDTFPSSGNYIYQPKLAFDHEVSFFFIDNAFAYALASAGPTMKHRWQLSEVIPAETDIVWAQQFVKWNKLPYGLQRIDACRLSSGELLLMEVEDSMPFLSLLDLPEHRRHLVVDRLIESIWFHLSSARPSQKIRERAIAATLRAA